MFGTINKFLFSETEKSSFSYFFAHWSAYQMIALKWRVWKPKFLFHDVEKPFLRLFLPYKHVRKFHRRYHKHHIAYRRPHKINWLELAIDWECSFLTKEDQPMNAWTYAHWFMEQYPEHKEKIEQNLLPLLIKIGANVPFNRNEVNNKLEE